ncbi:hypothetical protein ACFSTC_36495 [Nonomuraea ferruginea]
MAILIRTGDVPPGQRLDAWRSVVCDTLGPLDFHIARGTPLRGGRSRPGSSARSASARWRPPRPTACTARRA